MSPDKIAEKVQDIIAQSLDVGRDEVALSASFVDDLNADSLDIVELVIAMEKEFDLDIPDEEAENIQTVQDAVNYVTSHIQ